MVFKKTMKRKRKGLCSSPLLDDSPKRIKVQAQRKFAAGSNVNSPVITPIRELECDLSSNLNTLPEPVELLPIKRPNTEDFLTFLCFRGTPILPPTLNFFNTASIVDTNGQVHEIKSESSAKNGPIDIAKCSGNSSEKPFIAFGVRKRADPIVISRQMDKKRRHALAIAALRRKYQEQKMAKIRALTISKLSEKTTNRTLIKTNTVNTVKTETVAKKNTTTLEKTKVISTKHVKVTTQTLRTSLRTKVKPRMCLRSFRGRFIQKELPFRKIPEKKVCDDKKVTPKKNVSLTRSGDKNVPANDVKQVKKTPVRAGLMQRYVPVIQKKIVVSPAINLSSRVTRSGIVHKIPLTKSKLNAACQTMKKRILIVAPKKTVTKSKLRSTTIKKTVISQKKATQRKQKRIRLDKTDDKKPVDVKNLTKKDIKIEQIKKKKVLPSESSKATLKTRLKEKDSKQTINKELDEEKNKKIKSPELVKRKIKVDMNKEPETNSTKIINEKTETIKKETNETNKRETSETIKKETKNVSVLKSNEKIEKKVKKNVILKRSTRTNLQNPSKLKLKEKIIVKSKIDTNRKTFESIKKCVPKKNTCLLENSTALSSANKSKSEKPALTKKKSTIDVKEKDKLDESKETKNKSDKLKEEKKITPIEKEIPKKKAVQKDIKDVTKTENKLVETVSDKAECNKNDESLTQKRPSRKTKEAAAIYMEILSHKLVNDSKADDDNVSIDSFPELPNVKKTEQRENELKAQAKTSTKKEKSKDGEEIQILETADQKNIKVEDSKNEEDNTVQENVRVKQEIQTVYEEKPVIKLEGSEKEQEKNKNENKVKENVDKKLPDKKNIKLDDSKNLQENERYTPDIKETKTEISDKKNVKLEESKKELENTNIPQGNVKDKTHAQDQTNKKLSKAEDTKKELETIQNIKENVKDKNIGADTKKNIENVTKNKPILVKQNISSSKPGSSVQHTKKSSETKTNMKKEEPQKVVENTSSKRQTRITNTNKYNETDSDSFELYQADVKVNKKRKIAKTQAKPEKQSKKNDSTNKEEKVASSSDSDQSTTSDINLKTLQAKTRNKKFSKTKSTKAISDFSDSDEEPLSKLTSKSISAETSVKENKTPQKVQEESEQQKDSKEVKPKRECAKRPQNYFAMLSSSEDDEPFFHGFSQTTKPYNVQIPVKPTLKPVETSVSNATVEKAKTTKRTCYDEPLAPSLDLFGKDLGRKSKVNMSNEQIEKWLKDAALAGSSIKKENDAMLKFGIPTDTSLEICDPIDTQKLKTALLEPNKDDSQSLVETKPIDKNLKSHVVSDKKLIFRKDKKDMMPNKNAFSPENECSIYAFGEDNEEALSTPFRRPSRRPSNASRSEDESLKQENLRKGQFRKPTLKSDLTKTSREDTDTSNPGEIDDSNHSFNVPQNPFHKLTKSSMVPPSSHYTKKTAKTPEKSTDDDFKYKVPSSPSASSSSSAKLYKRQKKNHDFCPSYASDFPKPDDFAKLVEAPVFHPTDQEFQDPLEYIERVRHKSEQFGICRIVPPNSFKPECKVSDDMRFTSYNQYVHKMYNRWGPNFKELMAIKKYLATQNISLKHPPWIGGMEIDLPRLYQTVQGLGGLKEVIEKKKWPKVSDCMKIPKSAQDRVTKLDDIYCKYLLPYDTLSPAEREKLFDDVETEWAKKQSKNILNSDRNSGNIQKEDQNEEDELEEDEAEDECVVKGRNMALNAFYRIARNTMSMHFKTAEPSADEVEQEFWKYVIQRQNHICVHSGSIDCGPCGYGFAVSKNSPFARHAWNLKVLTNNSSSILRSLGPLMGVTVPTLHVGMVFSSCCWSRDPHGLPWIEYLHTGGNKIWYGVPDTYSQSFHSALKNLVPHCCQNKQVWLPSDTVMVPPNLLLEHQVSVCRTVQEPGQFVVVFPKAFTSSISTGYVVSESVYFAPLYWLKTARSLFNDLKNSCEEAMFSFDKLLVSVATDARSNVEVLRTVLPHMQELIKCDKERISKLRKLTGESLIEERIDQPEIKKTKKRRNFCDEVEFECEICRMHLFLSMVVDTQEEITYCLDHATELVESKKLPAERIKFHYTYNEDDLDNIISRINSTIESKLQKKVPHKYYGMPTLLTK